LHEVYLEHAAEKDLKKLPGEIFQRLIIHIKSLAESPTFSADEKTIDAVVRNLEVIGEAVRHIPADIRERYPAIAWHRIAGLRNILIQEYFAISMKIIWDIVTNKLPILEQQIKKIIED
jgi:uncharacterized protein with HEPN domain